MIKKVKKERLNALIVGAIGYTGSEIIVYLQRHSYIKITALSVSSKSAEEGKLFSDIYPQFKGMIDLKLQNLMEVWKNSEKIDVVFIATSHEVSHDIVSIFLSEGCIILDLSGSFRVKNISFYYKYYGMKHQHLNFLYQSAYGLAEWEKKIKTSQIISVPGCYPTIAMLALKPLIKEKILNIEKQWPVINAISGMSGSGRKKNIKNSFCEISIQSYNIFHHKHKPEITSYLGTQVIFSPHLGRFKRGILETITCRLQKGKTKKDVADSYKRAYSDKKMIRIYKKGMPVLKSVLGLPFCDIGFSVHGENLIIIGVEDNLLKGCVTQAIQCLNIRYEFPETESII